VPYVGGLEVEEVEEGGVVHGGRGPRRGDPRGIEGETVCEGGFREDAGAQRGKRSGEDAGRDGRGGGPERGDRDQGDELRGLIIGAWNHGGRTFITISNATKQAAFAGTARKMHGRNPA